MGEKLIFKIKTAFLITEMSSKYLINLGKNIKTSVFYNILLHIPGAVYFLCKDVKSALWMVYTKKENLSYSNKIKNYAL